MQTGLDRRTFLTRAAAMGGGLLSAAALERMSARSALADPRNTGAEPYGPLRPVADQRGVEVLALPAGFAYVTFGHIGTTMSDRNPTPLAHDGMGAFRGRRFEHGRASGHIVRLIRNSEDRNPAGTKGGVWATAPRPTTRPRGAARPRSCTTRTAGSCSRTSCRSTARSSTAPAGPRSRHRSWISGEEAVGGPDAAAVNMRFGKRHGYLFETPVRRDAGELEVAEPIVAAGRFAHEACAVDQATGIVYETEDPGGMFGAGFYRYTPDDPRCLLDGGALHMLAIDGIRRRTCARTRCPACRSTSAGCRSRPPIPRC